ncbi:MAG: rhodanese-like domain-containing protein [Candidatus Pacebacteria bacterium]|nr:rhodanese-like domain-containing protein [Candidatus Paceibacterota bacterium]
MGVALGAVLVGSGVLFFAKTASVPAAGLESSALQTIAAPTFLAEYRNDANAVVLDVRTPAEFAEGHMKDAVLMDFYAPDFNEKIAQLDKDASYYVYCRSGNRSGKTLAMMRELGFTQVRDAAGGIGALEKAGADVVR